MQIKLNDALCFDMSSLSRNDILISGQIPYLAKDVTLSPDIVLNDCLIFPGFLDVHVHLREPGFSHKEKISTGTLAAARGGYTDICSMPNLAPVPDSLENLNIQRDIIANDAVIGVHPYGSITVNEEGKVLSDMVSLSPYICAFSDDGRGVQSDDIMRAAMLKAKSLSKIIAAHCEDNLLLFGGYINSCEYQRKNGHRGISNESEWKQIERDLKLAKETGCDYHVCHISTKESVDLIRKAKKEGVMVTCETAPHYLLLDDRFLCENACFKMNPPLRSFDDRQALIDGICDGTIDMIATDHAPHTDEEKSRGLEKSPMGIVGLETAFPLLYTYLVKKNIITLEKLLELMVTAPRRRFSVNTKDNTYSVIQLNKENKIDSKKFLSMGHSTPFEGMPVSAECIMTVYDGRTVWQSDTIKK